MISVSVCYGNAEKQVEIVLSVDVGSTVQSVIEQSMVLNQFPEIDLSINPVGIFYKRTTLDKIVLEGDRVEIYRRLTTDPKDMRRTRATGVRK